MYFYSIHRLLFKIQLPSHTFEKLNICIKGEAPSFKELELKSGMQGSLLMISLSSIKFAVLQAEKGFYLIPQLQNSNAESDNNAKVHS